MKHVLGIETSCDETSAAVVFEGRVPLSNIVASQDESHSLYGGIVPEIAARCHSERIGQIVEKALDAAGLTLNDIDGVAVTAGPGLMGSLIVGLSYAKALAYAKKIPVCGIDHLEAHLHAIFLKQDMGCPRYPFVGLIVSGGHTILCDVRGVGDYRLLGTTRDDAAGEAFDKVAKLLGLGYPGGRKIDESARRGDRTAISFPRPRVNDPRIKTQDPHGQDSQNFNFSFSGLKTSVLHYFQKIHEKPTAEEICDIAASFQEAAVDILVQTSLRALDHQKYTRLVVAGGVAANSRLREVFDKEARVNDPKERGIKIFFPPLDLCTDNAAMVAALGYHYLKKGESAPLSLNAYASEYQKHS